jgi:hypothetical protein
MNDWSNAARICLRRQSFTMRQQHNNPAMNMLTTIPTSAARDSLADLAPSSAGPAVPTGGCLRSLRLSVDASPGWLVLGLTLSVRPSLGVGMTVLLAARVAVLLAARMKQDSSPGIGKLLHGPDFHIPIFTCLFYIFECGEIGRKTLQNVHNLGS